MADEETHLKDGGVRGDDDKAADAVDPHKAHAEHRRRDELLDEGVEETFPASDPVAVKHIT